MPLLEAGPSDTSATMEVEDGYRPRSGSFGIKNIFRKRTKSGDSNSGDPRMPNNKTPPPTTPTGKMKNFLWGSGRPRSRSDAATSNAQTPPVSVHRQRSSDIEMPNYVRESSESRDGFNTHYGSHPTPMSHLLSPSSSRNRHISETSNHHIGPEQFIEMYRSRAYSEPKPNHRTAAVAAARRKRVSHLSCSSFTSNKYYPFRSVIRPKYHWFRSSV